MNENESILEQNERLKPAIEEVMNFVKGMKLTIEDAKRVSLQVCIKIDNYALAKQKETEQNLFE
jgi:hypothetical protein